MAHAKKGSSLGKTLPLQSGGQPRWNHAPTDDEDEVTAVGRHPALVAPGAAGAPGPAPIEVRVVPEHGSPAASERWRAYEIWTRRHVYGLDGALTCFEILERESGRLVERHAILGSKLGGGRLREAGLARFANPLPLPGMEAMFMSGKKHGYTSAVERVVLRVRVLHTRPDEAGPTWEEVAQRGDSTPPPARRGR